MMVIAVALAGLTGAGGIWSSQQIEAGAARLKAPRVARRGAVERLDVVIPAGQFRLDLDPAFTTAFELVAIDPIPKLHQAVASGRRLTFATTDGAPSVVHLHVRPLVAGTASMRLTLDPQVLSLSLIILP